MQIYEKKNKRSKNNNKRSIYLSISARETSEYMYWKY